MVGLGELLVTEIFHRACMYILFIFCICFLSIECMAGGRSGSNRKRRFADLNRPLLKRGRVERSQQEEFRLGASAYRATEHEKQQERHVCITPKQVLPVFIYYYVNDGSKDDGEYVQGHVKELDTIDAEQSQDAVEDLDSESIVQFIRQLKEERQQELVQEQG